MTDGPCAAQGGFPYPARTVAQWDIEMSPRIKLPDPVGEPIRRLLQKEQDLEYQLRCTRELLTGEVRTLSNERGLTVPMRADQVRAEIRNEQ